MSGCGELHSCWCVLPSFCPARASCVLSFTGTLGNNQSAFNMEMSQIGFSTHTLDVSPT